MKSNIVFNILWTLDNKHSKVSKKDHLFITCIDICMKDETGLSSLVYTPCRPCWQHELCNLELSVEVIYH